jgi:hypothetical protein
MMRRSVTAAALLLSSYSPVHAWTVAPAKICSPSLLRAIKAERPDLEEMEFDLTGGRPGAIVETEEQLERKEAIFDELEERGYPEWFNDYGELLEMEGAEYDLDDPEAIDSSTLGIWDIHDLKSQFDYEYDPASGDPDPNLFDSTNELFVKETEKDEEGIEVGWDPVFGPSNPIDTRTKVGTKDSYMVDEATRDDSLLMPVFNEGDPEADFNEEIRTFRKSLDIIESYTDPFLPGLQVPRHVAKWHGYPIPMTYPQKNYTNNRFTKEEHVTPFDDYAPHKARKLAVQYARAKNCEWLPAGVSTEHHEKVRAPYEQHGTLVGTLRKGDVHQEIVERIRPALKILGSCAELLSTENEGTVFRFHYHGLIKNKFGMAAWTETLIRDCGVKCTGVVFETGFRKRDPAYDGGDPWYGPY